MDSVKDPEGEELLKDAVLQKYVTTPESGGVSIMECERIGRRIKQ